MVEQIIQMLVLSAADVRARGSEHVPGVDDVVVLPFLLRPRSLTGIGEPVRPKRVLTSPGLFWLALRAPGVSFSVYLQWTLCRAA
jgi:hypothetical protein